MKFTDNNPKILEDVRPTSKREGPIAISNHSEFGFNIRHFYLDWRTQQFTATRKGVAFVPADVPVFLEALVEFINENDVLNGRTVTVTIGGHDE